MDVSNEQDKTGLTKPPLLPKPCLGSMSSGPAEHVIPQMVITSPDESEEAECTSETLPSLEVTESLREVPNEPKDINVQPEIRLSEPIDDGIIETHQITETSESAKGDDAVAHSAVQRPLIFDCEKSLPQSNTEDSGTQSLPESPSPPPSIPSVTSQRPLVFGGQQPDNYVLAQEDMFECHLDLSSTKNESPETDGIILDELNLDEECTTPEPSSSKSKPSGFSWMPTFPKLHAKDGKISDVGTSKKDKDADNQKLQNVDQSPVKKDGLHNVKKFFDNLMHDTSGESKDVPSPENQSTELPGEGSKKAHKDGKHGIKKLFSPSKESKDVKFSEKDVLSETKKDIDNVPKEANKDSKSNIKKMFDSFMPTDKKEGAVKKEIDIPQLEVTSVQNDSKKEDAPKESKSNLKKMFDSFKHVDKKDSPIKKETISSPIEINPPQKESKKVDTSKEPHEAMFVPQIEVTAAQLESNKEDSSKDQHKESKSNLKKMFDSFKHVDAKNSPIKKETISSPVELTLSQDESKKVEDTTKESKSNIKKMFDSFKHVEKKDGLSEKEMAATEMEPHIRETIPEKESKSGIKKFLDSFKHEEVPIDANTLNKSFKSDNPPSENVETPKIKSSLKSSSDNKHSDNKESTNTNINQDIFSQTKSEAIPLKKEPTASKQANEHGVKNFFHSFKSDTPSTSKDQTGKFHVKFLDGDSSLKRSHSFQESILLKEHKSSDDSEKHQKESFHGVRKYFSSTKSNEPDSFKATKKEKSKEIKRSQSCKETLAEKEGFHGIRGFFDSFTHKSSPKVSSQTAISPISTKEEHIYDTVGKPEASTSASQAVQESTSKQTSAKLSDTNKDEHSGMRKLFDTFRHKDSPSAKQKTTRDEEYGERTYEKIDISSSVERPSQTGRTFIDMKRERVASEEKNEALLQSSKLQKQKETTKTAQTVSSTDTLQQKKAEMPIPPSIEMNGPSTSTDPKTSVFHSISDNFMAIKDKVLHSKEKKSEVALSQAKECEEYDLQIAASKNQQPDLSAGTFKPLRDDFSIITDQKTETQKVLKTIDQSLDASLPSTSQNTSPKSAMCSPKQSHLKDSSKVEPETPDTLYDTCCVRIARLLGKKALEIVTEKTKTPPKKPPKPSAEAIAKARAEVVSQRLRDLQSKGQSIGASIPVGYDGIRFADDETESSCDYKDVDNLDYILDYELINRYKFDGSKIDGFSAQSTCSVSSYYTADTVTLKDEHFSDAPLETISLGSNDSHLFQHLSANNQNDFNSLPAKVKAKDKNVTKLKPLDYKTKDSTNISTPKKKIPPPLPPKPVWSPKLRDSQNKSSDSQSNKNDPVSQCINGLSLSPRLQSKFSKDTAATQKRPLLVAGLKGTEFTSLQTKSKDSQNKRTFNTVLKNESLKKISPIAPLHPPLQSTKSSPSQMSEMQNSHQSSLPKKATPQRPPPPFSPGRSKDGSAKTNAGPSVPPPFFPGYPEDGNVKANAGPPVPEKPKRESKAALSQVPTERRTISPIRPPPEPPVAVKTNVPPPRPPPPITNLKETDKHPPYQNVEKEVVSVSKSSEPCAEPVCSDRFETQADTIESTPIVPSPRKPKEKFVEINLHEDTEIKIITESDQSSYKSNVESINSSQEYYTTPEPDSAMTLSPSLEQSPQSSAACSPVPSLVFNSDLCIDKTPKPPPRSRRIRSRTVEIAPKEKLTDPTPRRSQSLTDLDVQKRTESLNIPTSAEKSDLKHLYTSVNKDGKRSVLNGSQSPNIGGRPLPAPPPPPRKFRSLDRKPKDKLNKERSSSNADAKENTLSECDLSSKSIKPPERKKKLEKQRFHSLSTERKKTESEHAPEDSRMPRSNSVPLKPDRRLRHGLEYDENANVSFPVVAEVHHSAIQLDECGNEILDTPSSNIPPEDTVDSVKGKATSPKISPHPRQKKEKNSKIKSHSSWYDDSQASTESWEMIDWDPKAIPETAFKDTFALGKRPMRRRSDPLAGRKEQRRTSQFYVNVDLEEGLPLVDKETSPLHLDCSEKSVQTSLETLSQGIISRDEQSENTESSDNTDNLISMVKTLQTELKTTLDRHKVLDADENGSSSNAPTDSEKADEPRKLLKVPSNLSSASENWPVTSSEESDGDEIRADAAANLSEIAITRKKKKVFYIAQEIMTSEEVFVDTLKLLNVDFKTAVETANKQRNSPIIPDEVLNQILNHLPQLQHLNENLLMELKDRIENWDKSEKIADVIVKMGPFLKLYSWFIHDFESNLSLLEESKRKYPLFAQTIKEFEASARCKRLTINHFMLKPIQRIPQYRLLLQEYFHNLSEESPDYQDTVTALQIVSEVANHANDSMKQGDNAQKLISIQNSIMGHKEIIKPGRLFMKEGELMKLSRKGMQPRWFVLFNDLLLYLTPVQQGLYRINHELPLTGMRVAIPIQQDYQNEFSIISVTRSFTLAARSQEEREEWITVLENAIKENASKRSTFTNTRLSQRVLGKKFEDDSGEFVLGRKAPVWIPDARVTMCQLCTSEFTVTFRRHHCRACGKVVCSICSNFRIPLAYVGGNKVNRVCDECYSILGPDAGGCLESAETDSDNQQIAVKPHLRTERYVKKGKRNLPSVLKEVCANDQGSTISGYLQKRIGKSWKREWFVVKDKVLYEYKASEDVAALRSIPLLGYQIESFSEVYENVDSSLLFQLTHPGQAPIIFHADSVGSTERWIAALKEASVLE